MSEHSTFSASKAYRWIPCPPSARLEATITESGSSAAAREGTAAHALAEYKLRKALGDHPMRPSSEYDCDEMEGFTDDYVTFVLEQLSTMKESCADAVILTEQRVDFSRFVHEGFGTADCIIIADGALHVIDFKYGRGHLVEAEYNPQMQLYALGALEIYDHLYDISAVSMTIFQPRRENVSTWTVFKESLYAWAEHELKPAAELAYKGEGDFCPGEHCDFCRVASTCRARAKANLALAKHEFNLPPTLTDKEIGEILPKLDALVAWAKDIKAYAMQGAIHHGKSWPGLKLVEGRSVRKYTDTQKIAEALMSAGYSDGFYRRELLPITEMERFLGKKRFSDLLGKLIIKLPGKPTLVPIFDKREPISTAMLDFADYEEDPYEQSESD